MSDDTYATSVRIIASPDEVFPYLTDPALITRWMGEWAEVGDAAGGTFALDINGSPVRGEVLAIEPPHRLVFTWGVPGDDTLPAGSTTVEITLRADGVETVLDLVHRDLPPEELDRHGIGWSHFLPRLVLAAGGGDPGPDPWANAEGDAPT